jgi:alpha-methylacyl-CoA racemase
MPSTEFLSGVRIITMAQYVPGPLAVARMKRAGALVTKVEPPTGDPLREFSPTWYAELHGGIAVERLDLKANTGRSRMTELLREAEIFVTSQRPSALAKLGLDPERLRLEFAQLRLLRILGSVHEPERAGHDLTYQAQAGLVGDDMPRTLAADVMASERAFAGVLALLRQPAGSTIDVGVVESLDSLIAPLRHGVTAPGGPLGGSDHRYRLYAAKTGRVAVAALEPHFETRLYDELDLAPRSDPSSRFLERSASDWESWAGERDLPIVAVASDP